jgi:hypothetical protein
MTLGSIMPKPTRKTTYLAQSIVFVFALLVFCSGAAHAQHGGGAFGRLTGQWAGSGTIDLSNDLPADQNKLELNIRCASDSYNFDLFGSAVLSGHAVSGTWSESTHAASGTISGTAEGDRIQVRADSPGFTANLSLTTHGNRQSVLIRTPDPSAGIKGATINLRRRG